MDKTSFFRHPAQFGVLAARLPAGHGALRVWSAGCSTGEEAYSLAIVLDECGLFERARICATDASARAIARARRAHYLRWSRHGTGPARLKRCFTRDGDNWTVAPRRRAIDFRLHDLLGGAPDLVPFDVILCRNVLLHLTPPALERAAHVLVSALAPGGTLVTSPTDPPLPASAGLEPQLTPAGFMYRHTADARVVLDFVS